MAIRNEVLASPPGYRCKSKLLLDGLPFAPGDVTAGSEDELQAVVVGSAAACDLPITIRDSRFLKNIARRSSSGEAPRKTYLEVQHFLSDTEQTWETSWVRFRARRLSGGSCGTHTKPELSVCSPLCTRSLCRRRDRECGWSNSK